MIEEELLTNEQFTKEGSDVKVTTPLNTIDVKPGVQELFDSNPELANQVYEALGLNTTIVQDNKSYYRGQIEEPIIDKNGNLVLYAKEDELYKSKKGRMLSEILNIVFNQKQHCIDSWKFKLAKEKILSEHFKKRKTRL
jgi:hypothetical protein